ncbi:MAG: ATPase [Lachnospiraceae bacterium]|nr:ATPase [Lachnospiraceae bacterium]
MNDAARSIVKNRRFREKLFSRFTKAVTEYELVKPGDRIAVCISGGKDSTLMALLFQELKRCNKFPFSLEFLVMDPGYAEINRRVIEGNAKRLEIPITIFDSPIYDTVFQIEKNPCYLCARMRRGYLYKKAEDLGCNKIALGHHYDDVIETILMGMLWGGQVQTMMPKLHSQNFEGIELIRPMYLIREEDIIAWRDANKLEFIRCACRFTETVACSLEESECSTSTSKRLETKKLIQRLREDNPFVEANIFNSVKNVNLNTILAYKKDDVVHSFLDNYDK